MNDEIYSDENFERLARLIVKAWPDEAQALDHARHLGSTNRQGVRLVAAVQTYFPH